MSYSNYDKVQNKPEIADTSSEKMWNFQMMFCEKICFLTGSITLGIQENRYLFMPRLREVADILTRIDEGSIENLQF